jgi:DNA mismatch repair protein MutL
MASGRLQHFFVGKRPFRDRSILHAVQEGYRGRLLSGRQPIVFLRLEVPPLSVDVNVHPAKMEVRFRDPGRLHRLVLSTIRRALLGLEGPTALRPPGTTSLPVDDEPATTERAAAGLAAAEAIWQQQVAPTARAKEAGATAAAAGNSQADVTVAPAWEQAEAAQQAALPLEQPAEPPQERAFQLHNRYLVVETESGIEVIDQHALHERVLYEQLRERVAAGNLEVQALLVPERVELTPAEFELVTGHLTALGEAGVRVESFGGSTVVVQAKPALVGRTPAAEIIREVIDRLAALDAAGGDRRLVVEEVLHSLSCRAAIKAGNPLSQPEIDTLVADRHRYPGARHCPHGRPTSLMLSRQELDRQFRRT